MTKRELVRETAKAHGLPVSLAQELLEALYDAVVDRLIRIGRQTVPGLGTLTAERRPGRAKVDPETGQRVVGPPSTRVRFAPAESLRMAIRGDDPEDTPEPRIPRSDPLVEAIWRATGQRHSGKFIGHFILWLGTIYARELGEGRDFPWPGFGTVTVTRRPARPGRNPRTGAPLVVPPGLRFGFRPSTALKAGLADGPAALDG